MSGCILVVEDDPDLAELLSVNLQDLGYEVEVANDGAVGLARVKMGGYDLVILDIMLPRVDGIEICRQARAQSSYIPILMLTARSAELDRVLGLQMGADDYVTKPFSIPELLARVKAILRRAKALSADRVPTEGRISTGDMTIDGAKREVLVRGQTVELTPKEFDLLVHFAAHPGRVYTRSQLIDLVWGYGYAGYEHTVNSHINRLRAKIEADPARPHYIRTVWGVGYKFSEPDPRP